jgi:hypothetical protein
MLRLKLTHARVPAKVVDVQATTSLEAFRALAISTFSLAGKAISLFLGSENPPRKLEGAPTAQLGSLNIPNASVVDVRLIQIEHKMKRMVIAPDGNCLFASIHYLVTGSAEHEGAASQRASVAAAILSEPESYTEAVLGTPLEKYIAMISRDAVWGGGIELSVLSKLLELCIFAVEIRSGAVYKFGEGKYSRTGFLIYNGLHYDAMQEGATGKRLFEAPEEVAAALQDVLAIAEEARAAGQFSNRGGGSTTAVRSWAPIQRACFGCFFHLPVWAAFSLLLLSPRSSRPHSCTCVRTLFPTLQDIAGYDLRCADCGAAFGGIEAGKHAVATGHQNFFEYKTMVK